MQLLSQDLNRQQTMFSNPNVKLEKCASLAQDY